MACITEMGGIMFILLSCPHNLWLTGPWILPHPLHVYLTFRDRISHTHHSLSPKRLHTYAAKILYHQNVYIHAYATYNIHCREILHAYPHTTSFVVRDYTHMPHTAFLAIRKIRRSPHITFLVIRDKVWNSFSSEITYATSNIISYIQHSLVSGNTYITCNAVLRLCSMDFVWSHIWHMDACIE